ncbi:MAG: peptidogalycan biosysnthesis protein, partial [Rhodoferax sp.]|nr:peptidogalycan biosysnthesis protein [Rhodoferax sp.]
TAALSGGNKRATARSLNVCPYRATSVLLRRPRVPVSMEATSIVTRGAFRWSRARDISPIDWDFFYRCYEQTYQEHGNPPYLNRVFFERIANTMAENWLLFVAERGGRPMAASLIALGIQQELVAGARTLQRVAYGRYWGCLERVDCLHFEACYYQPLQWCIENKFDRFEGGAQGEHKLARALLPVANTSMHWLAHPAFSAAVDRFLDSDRNGVANYLDHLSARSPFRRHGDPIP